MFDLRMYDPCVVSLVELKMSSNVAQGLLQQANLNQMLVSEA